MAHSLIDRLLYNDLLLLLPIAESIIFELRDENDIHDNDDIRTSLVTIEKIRKKALSLLSSYTQLHLKKRRRNNINYRKLYLETKHSLLLQRRLVTNRIPRIKNLLWDSVHHVGYAMEAIQLFEEEIKK